MEFNGKDITELLALNRRNFLKLIVGGAVGTGLSPIPWKLADDSAIWTQNWPWVPVPPDGEFTSVKSVCTLCPGGCGIEVRKVEDRAVKIEGRTDYPVNPGGICPIGMGGLQLLYNEKGRFAGPAKRIGPRGSGKFQLISWDEAIDTLAKRITDLRKGGKAGALAAIDGNPVQSTMTVLVERLFRAIGSPNYLRLPSSEDTARIACKLLTGSSGPVAYDLENADYILSFGSGLLEGWGAPGRVINTWGLWRSGALKGKVKIVQIESRLSNTAAKADQWVPARPGTESALALGIASVIVSEGLYDSRFVENNSFGFSDWTSPDGRFHTGFKQVLLEKYSPGTVEKITGIDSKEIASIARAFAGARAPVALCGKGKGEICGSLYEFMAIHTLNALVGRINQKGGLIINDDLPLSPLPDVDTDYTAMKGLTTGRIDQPAGKRYPFSHSFFKIFTQRILDEQVSPVDTLMVFASNPAFTLPDGGDFKRALEKIPFIVSFSPYHDETSDMADLVLPDHIYLEKMDEVPWPAGLQYPLYGLTSPVIEPLYDTRQSGDVIIQLAKQVGGSVGSSFPWEAYEEVLKMRVKGLYDSEGGLTSYDGSSTPWGQLGKIGFILSDYKSFEEMWKRIKEGGLWYRPVFRYKDVINAFSNPANKFEFYSRQIEDAAGEEDLKNLGVGVTGDEAFMPHYEPEHESTGEKAFPLRMVPYDMINLSGGRVPSPPYLGKTLFDHQLLKSESFIEINPRTAKEYGLKEGDRVFIESKKGKEQARVHMFEGAMPGIVYIPRGLGRASDDGFFGGKGINPNRLIDGDLDPLSGQMVWWNTPVKISKA